AVETNLLVFINFPLVEKALQHSLHTFLVQRIDRRRPGIVTNVEFIPKRDELLGHSRDKLLRRYALALGRLLDFLPVLIDTGQKKYVLTLQPMIASNDISQDLFVGVTNMRRRVGVIDRRSDEKLLRHRR